MRVGKATLFWATLIRSAQGSIGDITIDAPCRGANRVSYSRGLANYNRSVHRIAQVAGGKNKVEPHSSHP